MVFNLIVKVYTVRFKIVNIKYPIEDKSNNIYNQQDLLLIFVSRTSYVKKYGSTFIKKHE